MSEHVGRGWNADWNELTHSVDSGDVFDSRDKGAIEVHFRANESSQVAQAAISKEPSTIYDELITCMSTINCAARGRLISSGTPR
ncbi:MAG: hypothetical protein VYC39_12595 [Myxococcota bacterium]|nr:hypothetical protein [Myxococcota bacterium]